MKRNYTLAIILLMNLPAILLPAQTGIEKKIIVTLSPDEKIANGENCFMLDKNPESISFVTVVGSGSSKQYFCYDKNGNRTGPVKQPDVSYWAECKDIEVDDCIADEEPKSGDPAKYFDLASGSVKFQGKTINPGGQVMFFYLSEDEQNFYAVAFTMDMKIIFFDKNNRKVELITVPDQVLISPDGTKAYAKIKGTINPFAPDAAQKMMDSPEEMNNPKINFYGIDGSKIGPYTSSDFGDAWFLESGQLAVYNNHELSLDGKFLFKSDDYISPCDMWISSNGKDYAWADYQNLFFSDGSKFTAPLVIMYVENGGRKYLKWLSLENKNDLVFYKKAF